jgi:hypothetical protein
MASAHKPIQCQNPKEHHHDLQTVQVVRKCMHLQCVITNCPNWQQGDINILSYYGVPVLHDERIQYAKALTIHFRATEHVIQKYYIMKLGYV